MTRQSARLRNPLAAVLRTEPLCARSVIAPAGTMTIPACRSRRWDSFKWLMVLASLLVVVSCSQEHSRRDVLPQFAGFRLGQAWQESGRDVPCRAGSAHWLDFDTTRVDMQLLERLRATGDLRFCIPADSIEVLYAHDTLVQVRIKMRRLPAQLSDRWSGLSQQLIPAFGSPDSVTWGIAKDRYMAITFDATWNPTASRQWLLVVSVLGGNGTGDSGWSEVEMQLDACSVISACPHAIAPQPSR